jgi:hypothetical protein
MPVCRLLVGQTSRCCARHARCAMAEIRAMFPRRSRDPAPRPHARCDTAHVRSHNEKRECARQSDIRLHRPRYQAPPPGFHETVPPAAQSPGSARDRNGARCKESGAPQSRLIGCKLRWRDRSRPPLARALSRAPDATVARSESRRRSRHRRRVAQTHPPQPAPATLRPASIEIRGAHASGNRPGWCSGAER